MEFRTKTDISIYDFKIGYENKGLILGSCFAENIGKKMNSLKFPVTVNPFGIIYNPLSVINSLRLIAEKERFTESDIGQRNGLWYSFDHHSSFSSSDKKTMLEGLNYSLHKGKKSLDEAEYIIITLGTSWVYRLAHNGRLVNNCHKFPASGFIRERLSVDQITDGFSDLFSKEFYERKKVILTVSPVRHIKDGLTANSLSKSILIVAIHYLIGKFQNVYYFPSYEIVNDELRDYRFYASDMLHPSDVAVDYIWQNFKESLISDESIKIAARIEKIIRSVSHRPLLPESDEYRKFTKKLRSEITEIKLEFPFLDLSGEEAKLALRE